jgi:hypothetical protein
MDIEPWLDIDDVTVFEDISGMTLAVFTVSLSWPPFGEVTFQYETRDGTAVAGADYLPASGPLTFPPGEMSQTVTVTVLGDMEVEPDEYFYVDLLWADGAGIGDGEGVGTIRDHQGDEEPPVLSIDDVIVDPEGDSGTTPAVFTVSLSCPVPWEVSVMCETRDGSAVAGVDYLPAIGPLTFVPGGPLIQPVMVPTIGDTLDEPDEYFYVDLWGPLGASIADGEGVGTIIDDDEPPVLSIDDVIVDPEGDSGTTPAVFTVSLSQASGQQVTVSYTTADGTAIAGADYQSTSGRVTFAPGEVSQPVTVPVIGDTLDEPDECFYVDLSEPANASIDDGQGVGTIIDDDSTGAIPGMTTWGPIAAAMLLAALAVAMMRRKYARLTA